MVRRMEADAREWSNLTTPTGRQLEWIECRIRDFGTRTGLMGQRCLGEAMGNGVIWITVTGDHRPKNSVRMRALAELYPDLDY